MSNQLSHVYDSGYRTTSTPKKPLVLKVKQTKVDSQFQKQKISQLKEMCRLMRDY